MNFGQKGISVLWILVIVAVVVQLGLMGMQVLDHQFVEADRLQAKASINFLQQKIMYQLESNCLANLKYLGAVPGPLVTPAEKFPLAVVLDSGPTKIQAGTPVRTFPTNANLGYPNLAVKTLDITKIVYRGVNADGNIMVGGMLSVGAQSVTGATLGVNDMDAKEIGDVYIVMDPSGTILECSAL